MFRQRKGETARTDKEADKRETSTTIGNVLLYKVLNQNTAQCLTESLFRLRDLNRGYDLRNLETDLALPKPKTNFLKRSFRYSGSMLWINLPLEAKKATSLHQFKRSIADLSFT